MHIISPPRPGQLSGCGLSSVHTQASLRRYMHCITPRYRLRRRFLRDRSFSSPSGVPVQASPGSSKRHSHALLCNNRHAASHHSIRRQHHSAGLQGWVGLRIVGSIHTQSRSAFSVVRASAERDRSGCAPPGLVHTQRGIQNHGDCRCS